MPFNAENIGPRAAEVLQPHLKSGFQLQHLPFGRAIPAIIDNTFALVSRGGYTGEDGFEVSPRCHSSSNLTWIDFHCSRRRRRCSGGAAGGGGCAVGWSRRT